MGAPLISSINISNTTNQTTPSLFNGKTQKAPGEPARHLLGDRVPQSARGANVLLAPGLVALAERAALRFVAALVTAFPPRGANS